jgi:hypothetical protein
MYPEVSQRIQHLAPPSIAARGNIGPRALARAARHEPKPSPAGQGWPVGEARRGREAQGTHFMRFLHEVGGDAGVAPFWLLFVALTKSDPPGRGGTKALNWGRLVSLRT